MKLKNLSIAGVLGLSIFTLSSGVFAETAANYESKATIKFLENNDITKPVDPEDPDKEVDIEDPDVDEGTNGPLSIDYASNIDFGEVKKSGNEQTYFAKPVPIGGGEERAPYVQVTDNRGTKSGWSLLVKQNSQFAVAGSDARLEGAQLSLQEGTVNSKSSTSSLTPSAITFNNFNEVYPVLEAPVDSGAGTFTNKFGDIEDGEATGVSLTVPADLSIEDGPYQTTLTWVLEDTPQN